MGVDHPGAGFSVDRLMREVRRIAKATLQNASIGRAGIRVYDGGWIRIEGGGLSVTGTATVSGDLNVTGEETVAGTLLVTGTETVSGTLIVSGRLEGDGTIDWTGPVYFKGPTGVQGNFAVSGVTTLSGHVTMNNDLTLGTGRIVAGAIVIDKAGGYGGRVYSGGTLLLDAGADVVIGSSTQVIGSIAALGDISSTGHISANSLDVGPGSKNFRIEHPQKPGYWLRHGSTESPVSGTEYTGRVTIGDDGSAVVELPDYFEALNKPENRTVQLTPIGRPFGFGSDDVVDGKVTVYGEPGREMFWLVKAERISGEFPLVEKIPEAA